MSSTAANTFTMLDIAKFNGSDAAVGLIDETIRSFPELEKVPARTIRGESYKTIVATKLPTVPFRQGNQGATQGKTVYENRTVSTYLMNPRWQVDKGIADKHEDGAAALLAVEAKLQMTAAMLTLAQQFYYGVSNDANGYPGLLASYDSANMTVDATGTTANAGNSIWLVKYGPQNVQWVYGNNGQMTPSDVMINPAATDASGAQFSAYFQEMHVFPGLQLGSLLGVVRIKNITQETGKGATDALLARGLALFPVGIRPDAIFMNRPTRLQLQLSRTVTLFGQAQQKLKGSEMALAPTPISYEDIPIYPTDALSSTEAIS